MVTKKIPYNAVHTVHVPYLPNFGKDIMPPEWFKKNVKTFGKNQPDIKDFELHEIQGTRLVYIKDIDEWVNLGHVAVYVRKEGPQ